MLCSTRYNGNNRRNAAPRSATHRITPQRNEGSNPMTAEELRDWRKTLRLSQAKAAEMLGCSRRTIQNYEAGDRLIPQPVALAIAAILFRLPPYGK